MWTNQSMVVFPSWSRPLLPPLSKGVLVLSGLLRTLYSVLRRRLSKRYVPETEGRAPRQNPYTVHNYRGNIFCCARLAPPLPPLLLVPSFALPSIPPTPQLPSSISLLRLSCSVLVQLFLILSFPPLVLFLFSSIPRVKLCPSCKLRCWL